MSINFFKGPDTLEEWHTYSGRLLKLAILLELAVTFKNYMDNYYILMAASSAALGFALGVLLMKKPPSTTPRAKLPTPQS